MASIFAFYKEKALVYLKLREGSFAALLQVATQIGNNGNFIRTSEPIVVNTWYHLEIKQVLDKTDNKVRNVLNNYMFIYYMLCSLSVSVLF